MKRLLIIGLTLMFSGCGTLVRFEDNPIPFQSVRADTALLFYEAPELWDMGLPGTALCVVPCTLVDYPFSLVTDVLCLPHDLWLLIRRGR